MKAPEAIVFNAEGGLALRTDWRGGGSRRSLAVAAAISGGKVTDAVLETMADVDHAELSVVESLLYGGVEGAKWATDQLGRKATTNRGRILRRIAVIESSLTDDLEAKAKGLYARYVDTVTELLPEPVGQVQAAGLDVIEATISKIFEALGPYAERRIRSARKAVAKVIADETGISLAKILARLESLDASRGRVDEDGAAVASRYLQARLTERIRSAINDPTSVLGVKPATKIAPEIAPIAEVREAIAVAAGWEPEEEENPRKSWRRRIASVAMGLGAWWLINKLATNRELPPEHPEDPDAEVVPVDEEPTAVDVAPELVANPEEFRWEWNPGDKGGVYERHRERDGVVYDSLTDSRLSTADDPFLSQIAAFDYANIFSYCRCRNIPTWMERALEDSSADPQTLTLAASSRETARHLSGTVL